MSNLVYSWNNHGWSVLLFGLVLGVVMVAWSIFTAFIGLLIIMLLLGHASWHAYKETVAD